MLSLMRTIVRRTLLIFIGIVIAFFIYSWIDPQGATKLINAIKGGTGSVQTGVIVTDISGTGNTSMNDSIIIPSNTGNSTSVSESSTGTFWSWIRGSSSTGTQTGVDILSGTLSGASVGTGTISTDTGAMTSSGVTTNTNTGSTLPQDFLDAVAQPDAVDPNTISEGKSDTTTTTQTTTINTPNTVSSQTVTRTITTTTTTSKTSDSTNIYNFDNQTRSTLSQQDIEDTKQLFSQLIDGANTSTNNSNATISSFVLTNYCRTVGSESCTNYRPNIQLRGNGARPSFVEFTRYENNSSTQYTNRSDIRIVQITNDSWMAYLPVSNVGSATCSQSTQRNLTAVTIRYTATINNQTVQGNSMGYGCGQ